MNLKEPNTVIRNPLRVPATVLLSLALLAGASSARAGFIGDVVTAHAYFPDSDIDATTNAVVASPGLEFDDFGADLASNGPQFDIDIEDASIEITVNGFFGIATPPDLFRGLEFTGLYASGAFDIVGFTLDVSPSISGSFGADRVAIGAGSVSVDFNNGTYFAGDRITINLQLAPSAAVPEPASLAMLSLGGLGLLGFVRTRRGERAAA
jgi:hypothetical protein